MQDFVGYFRVSTQKQGEDGYGMQAQRVDVQRYVESKGGQLLESFVEVESGSSCNRPEIWRAIDFCRRTGATLLIAKLDRLARNVSFISKLMDSGIVFIACDMPNASRFELHIRAALAEEERRLISERVKKGLERAKAKGVKLGGYRQALDKHNRKKRTDALEFAESLRFQFERMVAQGLSQQSMARTLNDFDIKTKQGAEWSNVQVGRILRTLHLS